MFRKKRGFKSKIKRRGGRKQLRGRGKPRLLGLNPAVDNVQKAICVETFDRGIIAANTAYMNQIEISRFPRAMAMAKFFKFYRCRRVIYEYRPDQNTFQAGIGQVAIPYAYYYMNRDGANGTGQQLNQYQAAGARPIKFTKKLLISYKPNTVHIADVMMNPVVGGVGAIGRTPIYDAWYATDSLQNAPGYLSTVVAVGNPLTQPATTMSVVQYFGHDIIFDQQAPAEGDVGSLTVTVEWEFKVPAFQAQNPPS